jgi:YidC/Oxa1 family membrane protein insertase
MASLVKKKFVVLHGVLLYAATLFAGDATYEPGPDGMAVKTDFLNLLFSRDGNIKSITALYRTPDHRTVAQEFVTPDQPLIVIDPSTATSDTGISVVKSETDSSVTVRFISPEYEKVYSLPKNGYIVDILTIADKAVSGKGYVATVMLYTALRGDGRRTVAVGKRKIATGNKSIAPQWPDRQALWYGVRNDFWFIAMKPLSAGREAYINDSVVTVRLQGRAAMRSGVRIYAGPIVPRELKRAGPECVRLLYPMWQWMRLLSFGLLFIFDGLLRLTGNTVLSILLLSLCVKLLIAPLFKIARSWQRKVNTQRSMLQPRLDEINKSYKGEEHNRRTLAVYKELGIHPLYSLKSLLSAAIQIPVFFAAYHMLSEHIALLHVPFAWMRDLSSPDRLFLLPVDLPYFGDSFNLLPLVMTAVTVATSFIHADASLAPALLRKQRASLYWMAALFFVLLYPCAAGMVLYWTMNNILALLSTAAEIVVHKRRTGAIGK